MRKNQNSIQESQIRLKLHNTDVVVCAYTKGVTSRRAFWLAQPDQALYVLVQYLQEVTLAQDSLNISEVELDQEFKISDLESA